MTTSRRPAPRRTAARSSCPKGRRASCALGLDGSRTTVHYSARKPSGQSNCAIDRIAAAPDNTLVVDDDCHRLVRVRLDGSVVETIPLTGALEEWADFPRVVAGASGDLWIGGDSSLAHRVGGVATKVALPETDGFLGPWAAAPDGSLWIAAEPGLRPDAHHRERRAAGAGADHRGGDGRRPGRDGVAHQPQPARPRRARGGARVVRSAPADGPPARCEERHGDPRRAAPASRPAGHEQRAGIDDRGRDGRRGGRQAAAGGRPARHHPALLAEAAAPHRAERPDRGPLPAGLGRQRQRRRADGGLRAGERARTRRAAARPRSGRPARRGRAPRRRCARRDWAPRARSPSPAPRGSTRRRTGRRARRSRR